MGSSLETRASRLLLVDVAYLDPAQSVFDAMMLGFTNQMKSRRLNKRTIEHRLQKLAAFRASAEYRYPWQWRTNDFDEFFAGLGDRGLKLGTLRGYQGAISLFIGYVRDPQYGWQAECLRHFQAECEMICHEGNMIIHASDYEGMPVKRSFTFDELETFFACADAQAALILRSRRKGALAALRNSAMLKVAYGFGVRRYALTMLDIDDFISNPEALQFGQYGALSIRYGKAVKGGQPRPYLVFAIPEMDWVIQAIKQYVTEIRPHYKPNEKSRNALFLTERSTRINKAEVDDIFNDIRDKAGLPEELTLHCLRHSFSSHMTEWGYDRTFVQYQLGHEHPSTTSIYQHLSSDFKQHQIRRSVKRTMQRAARDKKA
jgi:integrase/recombinase XerC